jgi:hypothetical protein
VSEGTNRGRKKDACLERRALLHKNDMGLTGDVLCANSRGFLTSTSLEIVLHFSVKEKNAKEITNRVLGFNLKHFLFDAASCLF